MTSAASTGDGGTGSGNGSGNGGSTALSSPVVYVSGTSGVESAGFIDARTLDVSSGALTPLPGSPFSTNYSNGGDMALSPNGTYAYVLAQQFPAGQCCVGPTFLLVYTLDPETGSPTLKQALAAGAPNSPGATNISVHPSGQFVYLSNYYQNNSNDAGTGIFSVQRDGTLVFTGMGGPLQPQPTYPAVIDPKGRFLFTASDGLPVGNPGNQACPLFYTDVWAFSIDSATGALTLVSGSPFTFQRQICEVGVAPQWLTLQIDPSGQRLFLVDSGNTTITVFGVDSSSGVLTLLPGSTVETSGPAFDSSAIDPKGQFLYVGGAVYSFSGYSFTTNSTSGTLPILPGMPVPVTPTPTSDEGSRYMAIDSSGTFLFGNENGYTSAFSCCGPDQVVEFRIDPNTGALTEVPSSTVTLVGTASKIMVSQPH